jgi:hypothetical protein
MSLHHNPLVDFLASYGPTAASNNMYDEFVVEAATKAGIAPIEITQPLVDKAISRLRAEPSCSIIFTGTAGDGKTFTARKVLERLTSGAKSWTNQEAVVRFRLGRRDFCFVKDLSELNEADKDSLFPEVMNALHGEPDAPTFVICVNDGHLLRFLRDRLHQDPRAAGVHQALTEMLRDDRSEVGALSVWLKNMSRQPHDRVLDEIIDQIVMHPGWKSCVGCPQKEHPDNPCPILVNRNLLGSKGFASLRARIGDMVRLAAADDRHLSVRQLLLLVVNILLGDSQHAGGANPLLTCVKATHRAREGAYHLTNPFEHAFGQNLLVRQRSQYPVFVAFEELGVGRETNNLFDGELLGFTDADLPSDQHFGDRIFHQTLESYRENPKAGIEDLRHALIAQRRRIFFSLDIEEKDLDTLRNPWNLTLFRYGGHYLRFVSCLESGRRDEKAETLLLKGLNRALTGAMTDTGNALWLTEPSGVFRGRDIPLLAAKIRQRDQWGLRVVFEAPKAHGRPPIFAIYGPDRQADALAEIQLRPSLFEFLLRVSGGALPTSFSNQCLQDIRRFQLAAVAQIAAVQGQESEVVIIATDDAELREGRTINARGSA